MATNTARKPGKVFNDSIHGHVELHPLLVKIINTPQFQRLRYIKQLGGGYFVYPGASHNRFEHSIGVAYLAGLLAKTLKENQPELKITDEDILCVEIAGLCHDLGHGPFSHLFDQMFMPEVCGDDNWKHEDASLEMFEYLLEKNNLVTEMERFGLKDIDLDFIKELILGEPLEKKSAEEMTSSGWPYKGREQDKSFLYEIVSNKQNGIDVDKFDYFARDCHHLGLKNNFDHMRYFKFARVIEVDDRNHICSRDKEAGNLYDLFYTRDHLHRRAYQHKVKTNVEIMIKDALLKAKDHIMFKGKDGKLVTLADAKNDMEAYTQLTDQVTERILESSSPELEQARKILERIMKRDFYTLVGEAKGKKDKQDKKISEEKIKSLEDKLKEVLPEGAKDHHKDYFEVVPITYSYGKGDRDPVECSYFYKKKKPEKAFTITKKQVSNFLPECFWEQTLRLYWKKQDETKMKPRVLDAVKNNFRRWCAGNGFQVDQDEDQHQELSTKHQKENSLEVKKEK